MTLKTQTSLAQYLASQRDTIIQCWRRLALEDKSLRSANSLSFRQFLDHIPSVLDDLASILTEDSSGMESNNEVKKDLAKHGFHRWQQGYKLSEVSRDWAHLHLAVLETVESYLAQGGDPAAARKIYRRLAELMHHGSLESTVQYEKLEELEAAAHLEEMKRNMLLASKNESADAVDFSHIVHDLKHEVSLIAGATELFNTDLDEKSKERTLHYFKHGVSSLEAMVGDLMVLAQLSSGKQELSFSEIDADRFLFGIIGKCEPMAKSMGLYLDHENEKLPPVETDTSKLTRVVQNLLINALKYTKTGGITVSWGNSAIDKHWFITVKDTGPGLSGPATAQFSEQLIPADEKEGGASEEAPQETPESSRAEPSDKTIRFREGLGLSIVKRLCELLDATLELDPDYNQGTKLTVHLPYRYSRES